MPQLIRCHGGVILLCAVLLAACGKKDEKAAPPAKPRAIEVMTLAAKPLRTTSEYLGSLLSRDSVGVLPQVAGYIRKIHVRPGMRVTAGAPLVEIDARDESAALSSASAQAESAATQRALAEQMLKRAEELYGEGLSSAQEIDQRRADLAAATAAVRAAGAQVSQRQVALSNRTIRAAVPGVVGDVNVRLGDYVTPTTPLTTIAQAAALELSVSVPAARARALALDSPVEVMAEDGSLLVESKVSFIAPEADPRTQLVEIKATFDNTMGLRPRELVRARVVYSTNVALQVPLLAVQRQASKSFAFVVADKGKGLVVEKRLIELGALRQHGYLVKKGLAEGDRVAVSSLMMLKDGAAVTIAPPTPPKKAEAPAAPAAAPAAATAVNAQSAGGAGK